jgi:hypothetical protein
VNPLQEKLHEIDLLAVDVNSTKALIKLRGELVRLYGMLVQLISGVQDENAKAMIVSAIDGLEAISRAAHNQVNFTYAPLPELEKLQ